VEISRKLTRICADGSEDHRSLGTSRAKSDVSAEADARAIIDATIEYCWALDERRFEGLRDVFTNDAVADFGAGTDQGIEAIIERVSTVLGQLDTSHHMISNHQVRLDGDLATCRCYLQAQHVRRGVDGGRNFIVAGRYDDEFVRTGKGWRIAQRRLTTTWTDGNRAVLDTQGEAG
jgi:hypothetical protein